MSLKKQLRRVVTNHPEQLIVAGIAFVAFMLLAAILDYFTSLNFWVSLIIVIIVVSLSASLFKYRDELKAFFIRQREKKQNKKNRKANLEDAETSKEEASQPHTDRPAEHSKPKDLSDGTQKVNSDNTEKVANPSSNTNSDDELRKMFASNQEQVAALTQQLQLDREQRKPIPRDLSYAPDPEDIPRWIKNNLTENEAVQGIIRRQWPHAIPSVSGMIVMVLLYAVYIIFLNGIYLLTISAIWIVVMAYFLVLYLKHRRYALVLTESRFKKMTGILTIKIATIQRSKITDYTYTRDLLGRTFKYWSFHIETAGQRQAFEDEFMLSGNVDLCNYFDDHLTLFIPEK